MNVNETDQKQQQVSRVEGATVRLMCMVGSIFSSPKNSDNPEEENFDNKADFPKDEAQWNCGSADPVHHEPKGEKENSSEAAAAEANANTSGTTISKTDAEADDAHAVQQVTSESETDDVSGSASEKDRDQEREPRIRKGDKRLLCPFSIKFSQTRCRPNFQDGREVDEACAQVTSVPFAEAWTTPEGGDETVEGEKNLPSHMEDKYDEFLAHPFPTIEVIRWRAKVRDPETGEFFTDPKTGKDKMGEEQWFTLDNRRLYALQKAAVKMWPKRCCVVVRVLRGDFGHALKKFKTLTNGRTVEVGHRFWKGEAVDKNDNMVWSWEAAVECKDTPQAEEAPVKEAILRDDSRENECGLLRAGGCAHLLELPKYKGEHRAALTKDVKDEMKSSFKLPASTKSGNNKRYEYWLASKEGTAPPKRTSNNASWNSNTKKEAAEDSSAPTTPATPAAPTPVLSMADKVAALARQRPRGQFGVPASPNTGKVLDLLSVMNKKKTPAVDPADAETTASSCVESSPDLSKNTLPPPPPRVPEEKRQEKRRQRARNQNNHGRNGNGYAAQTWVPVA